MTATTVAGSGGSSIQKLSNTKEERKVVRTTLLLDKDVHLERDTQVSVSETEMLCKGSVIMVTAQLRKPLIERKRRERINNCLDQLKETVVGAFRLDQSKLEKADILEMTVKHLQNIQNSKIMDSKLGLEAQQRYSTGYIQCMHEVHNLLLTCEWMDKTLGARLLNHLLKSLPRSSEETCKADLRSATPGSSKGNTTGSSQTQIQFCLVEEKQGQKKPFQLQPPSHCSQRKLSSPSHFAYNGASMGSLDMWRPW